MTNEGVGIAWKYKLKLICCMLIIFIFSTQFSAFPHNHIITVSGVVTDTEGNPVPFTSIAIENLTKPDWQKK
jgi:hypothetical protein